MEFARLVRVEAKIELIFPAEFKACLGQRVVANLCAGMTLSEVGGMRSELLGDDAFFDISFIRQAEVFLWCHVAQHCSAVPADHCRSDTGGDVVVTRRNICSERP